MPAEFLAADTGYPVFTAKTTTEDKVASLHNYVYLLVEQLRYSLFNLDTKNFNPVALDNLTSPIYARIENSEGDITELGVQAEGLGARISSAEGSIAELKVSSDGLVSRVQNAENEISQVSQTASGIQTTVANLKGDVSVVTQTVNGLTVTDANGTTYLNGNTLLTGTVTASRLLGETVGLLNSGNYQIGYMTMTGATSSAYAVELGSAGALRLVAENGSVYIQSGYGAAVQIGSTVTVKNNLHPSADDTYSLGVSGFRWTDIYSANATIQTSDREYKTDISGELGEYDEFYMGLRPVSYKFKNGVRTHIGFISNEVEENLERNSLESNDFAGFIKTPDEEKGYIYGLRYGEFIALNTWQIQKLIRRVEAIEGRLAGT